MTVLPASWSLAKGEQLFRLVRGVSYDKQAATSEPGPGMVPILRATNIQNSSIVLGDLVYVPQRFVSTDQYLQPGDLLIATSSGSKEVVGKAALASSEHSAFAFGAFCAVARPYACQTAEWLSYFTKSSAYRSYVEAVALGININNFRTRDLASLPLPLPPENELCRIRAKLDRLSARSSRARQELDRIPILIERYKQAILEKAFSGELTQDWKSQQEARSWLSVSVADVAEVVTGTTPPSAQKSKYFGGSTPFVKPTDLEAGYNVAHAREFLTKEGVERSRLVPAGSTLVTCIGATISKTGFARIDCCTNQQINALVPMRERVYPPWLYWSVISPVFRQSILDNASATTLPIINKRRFKTLPLPLPSLEEQTEIVLRIERAFSWIDKVAVEHSRADHLLPMLNQAILAKAFRGELVPQDPNDEPASKLLERLASHHAPRTRRGRPPHSERMRS